MRERELAQRESMREREILVGYALTSSLACLAYGITTLLPLRPICLLILQKIRVQWRREGEKKKRVRESGDLNVGPVRESVKESKRECERE